VVVGQIEGIKVVHPRIAYENVEHGLDLTPIINGSLMSPSLCPFKFKVNSSDLFGATVVYQMT
jgi:hypothetical protein